MNVKIWQGNQSFNISDKEVVVVIDVLRAGTTAYAINNQNIKEYYLVGNLEEAFRSKKENKDIVLIGEEYGIKIKGFDLGNSPIEVDNSDLNGKTIIHLTTNGVQALLNNQTKDCFFIGFSNLWNLADHIKKLQKPVNIIASDPLSDDDLTVAELLRNILLNQEIDFDLTKERILKSKAAKKFTENNPLFPFEELVYASEHRIFPYILISTMDDKCVKIKKLNLDD